jgi:hypothetical protein
VVERFKKKGKLLLGIKDGFALNVKRVMWTARIHTEDTGMEKREASP